MNFPKPLVYKYDAEHWAVREGRIFYGLFDCWREALNYALAQYGADPR